MHEIRAGTLRPLWYLLQVGNSPVLRGKAHISSRALYDSAIACFSKLVQLVVCTRFIHKNYNLFQFARAAITKYHRWSGLNNRNLSSQLCRLGSQLWIKELAGLVPSEGREKSLCPGLVDTVFSLCLYIVFPVYLSVSTFPLSVRTQVTLDSKS